MAAGLKRRSFFRMLRTEVGLMSVTEHNLDMELFVSELFNNKAFQIVVRSSCDFASSNCDWVKLMKSLILPNRRYCLQKLMKIELQVEMPYIHIYV